MSREEELAARLRTVEAERDAAREAHERTFDMYEFAETARGAAEGRVEALEAALQESLTALLDEVDHYATPAECPASTHTAIAHAAAALAVSGNQPQ